MYVLRIRLCNNMVYNYVDWCGTFSKEYHSTTRGVYGQWRTVEIREDILAMQGKSMYSNIHICCKLY